MLLDDMNKSGTKTKKIISTLVIGVVVIVGLLYWHNRNGENPIQSALPVKSALDNMKEKEITGAQEIAAMAAVSGKKVSGTITQRPDYVSEIEWQVLQKVAGNQPDGNGEQLTGLVNKLLFNKKKEAWLAAGGNTAERRQLARQLRDMLPEQLESEAIDAETATELEAKLNADLR